jgi:hypothetical protein
MTDLIQCEKNTEHRYRPDYVTCPFCLMVSKMQDKLEPARDALVGHKITGVSFDITAYGTGPHGFLIHLDNGTVVGAHPWAEYADSAGIDFTLNDETIVETYH